MITEFAMTCMASLHIQMGGLLKKNTLGAYSSFNVIPREKLLNLQT